jgi:hypothetical protein
VLHHLPVACVRRRHLAREKSDSIADVGTGAVGKITDQRPNGLLIKRNVAFGRIDELGA